MSSKRQQIVDALDARLKAAVASVSSRVFCWRKTALTVAELPALIYQDGEATTEMEIIGLRTHRLNVTILYAAHTKTSARLSRAALDEICAALFSDQTLSGNAESIELVNHDINITQDDDILGAAKIEIIITYRTAPGAV